VTLSGLSLKTSTGNHPSTLKYSSSALNSFKSYCTRVQVSELDRQLNICTGTWSKIYQVSRSLGPSRKRRWILLVVRWSILYRPDYWLRSSNYCQCTEPDVQPGDQVCSKMFS
jgi:hypothetical protein